MKTLILALTLASVGSASSSQARSPFVFQFGPEFTFSNQGLLDSFVAEGGGQDTIIIQTAESLAKLDQLKFLLRRRLVDPSPQTWKWLKIHDQMWNRNKLHLVHNDGFRIVALSDPGVIEVNHSPITVAGAEEKSQFLQETIFGSLRELSLEPMEYVGSGHIHMDLGGFRGDVRVFRDFLVDFHNHPGLAMGGFNHDIYNAVSLAELPELQKSHFRAIVDRVDSGEIDTIQNLVSELIKHVFGTISYDPLLGRPRAKKYHATSFAPSFSRFGTMEIRCIRPQASYENFIRQIRLFETRVNYLAARRDAGLPPIPVGKLLPVTPQEALAQLDSYVSKTGLVFENYHSMVLDWWQGPKGELQTYLQSKSIPQPRTCSNIAKPVSPSPTR